MEMHLPLYNFTVHESSTLVPQHAIRAHIIMKTNELTVYAPDDFALREICTLGDLRMVTCLLSSMFIGHVLHHLDASSAASQNPAWSDQNIMEPGLSSTRMFQLLEDGQSHQLYLASFMAFLRRLPYRSDCFYTSELQADALMRLATIGERVMASTNSLRDSDSRQLESTMVQSFETFTSCGFKLSAGNENLLRTIISKLNNTSALVVLDKEKIRQ